MSATIALIDYHAGNLTSVRKAFGSLGAQLFTPARPSDLTAAPAIVVPGVGHFGATATLGPEWADAVRAHVALGRPLLGICLGMQWLFEGSEEAPESPGLGVLAGQCYRLGARAGYGPPNERANGQPVKIPHVGWNELTLRGEAAIVRGIAPDAQVYFTHSYAAPVTGDTVAVTTHGETFASIVARDRVAGVQFHPEKSGEVGLEILRNFLRMVK